MKESDRSEDTGLASSITLSAQRSVGTLQRSVRFPLQDREVCGFLETEQAAYPALLTSRERTRG